MAEKAENTPNYVTDLLLMDMSKPFDRVERGKLIEDLGTILQDNELHQVKILMKDMKLSTGAVKRQNTERTNGRTDAK